MFICKSAPVALTSSYETPPIVRISSSVNRFHPSVGSVPFALVTSNVRPNLSRIPGKRTSVRRNTVKFPTFSSGASASASGSPGHQPRTSHAPRVISSSPSENEAGTQRPVCAPERETAPSRHSVEASPS